MRKYIVGFVCGALVMSSAAVYASDTIKATIFPVSINVNGQNTELPDGYKIINVEGRTYVPIRFVAESLDSVVAYDHSSKSIRIDNRFELQAIGSELRAGNLAVQKSGSANKITGEIYAGQSFWASMATSKNEVVPSSSLTLEADIAFYDQKGKKLGSAPIAVPMKAEGDQLKSFEGYTDHDVKGYAFATLEYALEPIHAFLPPSFGASDSKGNIAVGMESARKSGDFTKVRLWIGGLKQGTYKAEGTVAFYDSNDNLLGTAEFQTTVSGKKDQTFADFDGNDSFTIETAGKGDFAMAAKYTVTLQSFEAQK